MPTLNEFLSGLVSNPKTEEPERSDDSYTKQLLDEEAARQIEQAGGGRMIRTATGRKRYRIAEGEQPEERATPPVTFPGIIAKDQQDYSSKLLGEALKRRKKATLEDIFAGTGGPGARDKAGTPDVSKFVTEARKRGYSDDQIQEYLNTSKRLDIPLRPTGTGFTGFLGEVGRAGLRGLYSQGARDIARATQWFAPGGTGTEEAAAARAEEIKRATELNPQAFAESPVSRERPWYSPARAVTGGVEMMARMGAGMAAGPLGVPLQFWGSMAQDKYEQLSNEQPDASEAKKVAFATAEGIVQGGLEWLQSKIPAGLLGKFLPRAQKKNIIASAAGSVKESFPQVMKALGLSYLGELSTEVGQDLSSKELDYLSGLEQEGVSIADLVDSLKNNAGPMLITTGLLGGAAHYMVSGQRKQIHDTLTASRDNVTPEQRMNAALALYSAVKEQDPGLADKWLESVKKPLSENLPIAIPTSDEAIRAPESAREPVSEPGAPEIDPNEGPLSAAAAKAIEQGVVPEAEVEQYTFTEDHANRLIEEIGKVKGATPEDIASAIEQVMQSGSVSPGARDILNQYAEMVTGSPVEEAQPVQPAPTPEQAPGQEMQAGRELQAPAQALPAPAQAQEEVTPPAAGVLERVVQKFVQQQPAQAPALPAPAMPAQVEQSEVPVVTAQQYLNNLKQRSDSWRKQENRTSLLPPPVGIPEAGPEQAAAESLIGRAGFAGTEAAMKEVRSDREKEGRLARPEREREEPGRPVQEPEAGTKAPAAGGMVQAQGGEQQAAGTVDEFKKSLERKGVAYARNATGSLESYKIIEAPSGKGFAFEYTSQGHRFTKSPPEEQEWTIEQARAAAASHANDMLQEKKENVPESWTAKKNADGSHSFTIKTEPYNQRRYSKPWAAKVDFSAGRRGSFDFVDWYGDDGPGSAGVLDITGRPGDIIAVGQKDNRGGRNTTRDYYVVEPDGSVTKLKNKGEAYNKFKELENVRESQEKAEEKGKERSGEAAPAVQSAKDDKGAGAKESVLRGKRGEKYQGVSEAAEKPARSDHEGDVENVRKEEERAGGQAGAVDKGRGKRGEIREPAGAGAVTGGAELSEQPGKGGPAEVQKESEKAEGGKEEGGREPTAVSGLQQGKVTIDQLPLYKKVYARVTTLFNPRKHNEYVFESRNDKYLTNGHILMRHDLLPKNVKKRYDKFIEQANVNPMEISDKTLDINIEGMVRAKTDAKAIGLFMDKEIFSEPVLVIKGDNGKLYFYSIENTAYFLEQGYSFKITGPENADFLTFYNKDGNPVAAAMAVYLPEDHIKRVEEIHSKDFVEEIIPGKQKKSGQVKGTEKVVGGFKTNVKSIPGWKPKYASLTSLVPLKRDGTAYTLPAMPTVFTDGSKAINKKFVDDKLVVRLEKRDKKALARMELTDPPTINAIDYMISPGPFVPVDILGIDEEGIMILKKRDDGAFIPVSADQIAWFIKNGYSLGFRERNGARLILAKNVNDEVAAAIAPYKESEENTKERVGDGWKEIPTDERAGGKRNVPAMGGQPGGRVRGSAGAERGRGRKDKGGGKDIQGDAAVDEGRTTGARGKERGAERGGKDVVSGAREPAGERGAGLYVMNDEVARAIEKRTPTQRFQDNIEAIRVLKNLEDSGRKATAEEQEILARYSGWGGLVSVFSGRNERTKALQGQLKELVTKDEYIDAQGSSRTAFYTAPDVVRSIYGVAADIIGENKNTMVLEPSMGTGNFFGLMPDFLRENGVLPTGVELDRISAGIAKHLYQSARVVNDGFQNVNFADIRYDLVIGNPPFSEKTLSSKYFDPRDGNGKKIKMSLHNFFVARMVDLTRPGGIVAVVVSNSFMDANNQQTRQWVATQAEFLGGVRLPDNAFMSNTGTNVVTDILFFQKYDAPVSWEDAARADWIGTTDIEIKDGKPVRINRFFANDQEWIIGEVTRKGTMYGPDSPTVTATGPREKLGEEIADRLFRAITGSKINKAAREYSSQKTAAVSKADEQVIDASESISGERVPENVRALSYFIDKDTGIIYQRRSDVVGERTAIRARRYSPSTNDYVDFTDKQVERIKGMIPIRDAMEELLEAERTGAETKALRKRLNEVYDKFVKKYGYVSEQANALAFKEDPLYVKLRSLENNFKKRITPAVAKKLGIKPAKATAEKAAIFDRPVTVHKGTPTKVKSAKDALIVSLSERGRADKDFILSLYGKDEESVYSELGELVYIDPETGAWIDSDEYLSGNVKQKLSLARAMAEEDAKFQKNVDALEKVIPEDVEAGQIFVKVNSTWLEPRWIETFAQDVLGVSASLDRVTLRTGDSFSVDVINETHEYDVGSEKFTAGWLLERMLTGKPLAVYDRLPDGGRKINALESSRAVRASYKVNKDFARWLWAHRQYSIDAQRKYNDIYNTTVLRKYDGSHMKFPGMTSEIKLRKHQYDAVWRSVTTGKVLYDHVVGAGKTFTMIATAMEMKRIGMVNKPVFVVPNHLIEQWAEDFYRLYPNANILVTTKAEFTAKRRQEFTARMATGDWDAIVMAHSQFGLLPAPKEAMQNYLNTEIERYERSMREAKEADLPRRIIKQIEDMRDKLRQKLQEVNDRQDDIIDTGQIGIDALFVDEFHMYKNLGYASKMNVPGMGTKTPSKKNIDMFVKIQDIQGKHSGRNTFFATGTPVSNTLAEMFIMLKYMDVNELEQRGIAFFDNWASVFASVETDWILDSTGVRLVNKERMANFNNMPELMSLYTRWADVVSMKKLKENMLAEGKRWPVPKIKGGKPENVVVERSELQAAYMDYIVHRAENMDPRTPDVDNFLKLTTDATKAALDMRLIDPKAADHPGSKVNVAVRRIYEIYQKWNDRKGAQLVFLDTSIPQSHLAKARKEYNSLKNKARKGDEKAIAALQKMTDEEIAAIESSFSVYDDIKEKLIRFGIPEDQIAFIHDANTDKKKQELFDKVNSGSVRVLLGSTSKMGAGMNVQSRLVALHHIDAPWRPSDLEQREGRILRQGNIFYNQDPEGFEVEILRYSTKQTYDARRWQIIESKAIVVDTLRNFDVTSGQRTVEDIAGESANAAEMKAAASGDPRMLEHVRLSTELQELEAMREEHVASVNSAAANLGFRESLLTDPDSRLNRGKRIIKRIKPVVEKFNSDYIEEVSISDGTKFTFPNPNEKDFEKKMKAAVKAVQDKFRTELLDIGTTATQSFNRYKLLKTSISINGYTLYAVGSKAGGEGVVKFILLPEMSIDDAQVIAEYSASRAYTGNWYLTSFQSMKVKGFLGKIIERAALGAARAEDNIKTKERVTKQEVKKYKRQIDRPFEREAEYQQKLERFNQLSDELAGEKIGEEVTDPNRWRAIIDEEANLGYEEIPVEEIGVVGEDRAVYKGSQSGQPVTLFVKESGDGRPRGTARSINDAMEVYPAKIGEMFVSTDKVSTGKDAGEILAPLGRSAAEKVMVLVLDENKKPIAAIQHTVGTTKSSQVEPITMVSGAMRLKGARYIWIAHNHPTGSTAVSDEDREMYRHAKALTEGMPVEVDGALILTPEGLGVSFTDDRVEELFDFTTPSKPIRKIPVVERRIRGKKRTKIGDQIRSTRDAVEFIGKVSDGRPGILLMDTQHYPIAFVPITREQAVNIRSKKGARFSRKFYSAVDRHPGITSAIVYGDGITDHLTVRNIFTFAYKNGLRTIDVITDEIGSYVDVGGLGNMAKNATMFTEEEATYSAEPSPGEHQKLIEALGNTEKMNAEDGQGNKSESSPDEGEKIIDEIVRKMRKMGERRAAAQKESSMARLIKAYRKAMSTVADPHASTAEKQKAAAALARSMPEKPRAKLLTALSEISRVKREATKVKRLKRFMVMAEKELTKHYRRVLVGKIAKMATRKQKLRRDRIRRGKGWQFEELMEYIRDTVLSLDGEKAVQAELASVEERLQALAEQHQAAKTREEKAAIKERAAKYLNRRAAILEFGGIKQMGFDDLYSAALALKDLIGSNGKAWRERQEAMNEYIMNEIEAVAEEVAGGEPDISLTAKQRRQAKERTIWGAAVERMNAAINSIQSWEFFLDAITRKAGKGILKSDTVKKYGSIVQAATRKYERYSREESDKIHAQAIKIFKAKNKSDLKKKFKEYSTPVAGKVFFYRDGKRVPVELSPFQAAYWYQISKDFSNPNVIKTFDRMGITDRTVKQLVKLMGPEVKAWADYLVDEYYQDLYGPVNEVYRELYGVNLPQNRVYVPFHRDYTGTPEDMAPEHFFSGAMNPATMKKGSLKERVSTSLDFKVMDVNTVLLQHVSEMNHFRAWALPTKLLNGVFGSKFMKKLVRIEHGVSAARTMKAFLDDFMKSPNEQADRMQWLDRARNKVTASLIGLNFIVFSKQLTSIPAYAAEIPLSEWARWNVAAAINPVQAAKEIGRIMASSEMLKARYRKGFERDVAEAMRRKSSDVVAGVRSVTEIMMAPARAGDMLAIIGGGLAVYKYHYHKAIKEGKAHEEADRIAIEEFEKATERSQQASGVKDLGWFQRGGPVLKLFTMFMTTPASYSRIMYNAATHFRSDPVKASKILFIYGIVLPVLFRAVSDGFSYEDDDDMLKKFGFAILFAPFAGLPLIRTMVEGVINALSGHRYIDNFTPVTQVYSEFKSAAVNLQKAIAGGTKRIPPEEYWKRAGGNTAMLVGYGTGLPVRGSVRLLKAAKDVLSGETEHPVRRMIGYSKKQLREE